MCSSILIRKFVASIRKGFLRADKHTVVRDLEHSAAPKEIADLEAWLEARLPVQNAEGESSAAGAAAAGSL